MKGKKLMEAVKSHKRLLLPQILMYVIFPLTMFSFLADYISDIEKLLVVAMMPQLKTLIKTM